MKNAFNPSTNYTNGPDFLDKPLSIRKQIQAMANISRDGKYEILAGNDGLYAIAFFGHKGTKKQKDRLRYLWRMVMLYN